MVREVDMVNYYLPPYMQQYNEPVAALRAEEPEFTFVWKATDRVLLNKFISTADEYSISRYEKMLNIYPEETDSLELRRLRVQNKWSNAIPYTIRTLIRKLTQILGSQYDFAISGNLKSYEFTLEVYTLNDSKNNELEYTLSVILPLNMVINIIYEKLLSGTVFCRGIMCQADIIEIRQR